MKKKFPEKQGLYDSSFEHDSCGIGFVARINGIKSHEIIERGLQVLERMSHRGAESADNKTGDGSGILLQIPHHLYKDKIPSIPESGDYGTGIVFLPVISAEADYCMREFERVIIENGLAILAWRDVPVDNSDIGTIAKKSEPVIKQIFISEKNQNSKSLEKKLFIIRKTIEQRIRESSLRNKSYFYIPSFSSKTIVYKGMLTPSQVKNYYPDLTDRKSTSAVALVHSRFSTNTFPRWDLAQPFRTVAHNGEINTVKGNRFWMQARESDFVSDILGDKIEAVLPVIEPEKSDSASFDNALEMLVAAGRSLPHALMMLIPESWNEKNPIPESLKSFYEYHSTFMEPWDGPASIVFCDGRFVGGTLDRNGLRPSRYIITDDDIIVMGSEVGVQTFPPERIIYKGRLMPGKLLLVDMEKGRIIPDDEIKTSISSRKPYAEWVKNNRINLSEVPLNKDYYVEIQDKLLHELHLLHGYNREDINELLIPIINSAQEPTGSMGTDTPLAVFSKKPQLLFNYFKQIFAQVTNPPIDPIREELVMSLTSYIGCQKNLLDETPEHCRMIKFKRPILSNSDIAKIRHMDNSDFTSATFQITYQVNKGEKGLELALNELFKKIETSIDAGTKFIILSDRGANSENAPIPSLLASSGVHHHLIRIKKRTRVGLIIETAEPREVMHFALLFGYGACAVNPYGVFSTINSLTKNNKVNDGIAYHEAEERYIKAIDKGLLKVLSKMGTSTLRSYRGSQIFEAIGLGSDLVGRYFTGTVSRIEGIGLKEIASDIAKKHKKAYFTKPRLLESDGNYQYRKGGEEHAWNPDTIRLLQWAVRDNNLSKYEEFSESVNKQNKNPHVIRGLFRFKKVTGIPIDEVEPAEKIYKRITTGAMSYGSLSIEAHETIAIAMNKIGGRSNSGEGGEASERFSPRPDGSLARSSIKQVASGRFGVTANYLSNADEIQIKIAQGAKPGEGGQLPGHKVDSIIAKTRYSTEGVTLISPPPHHDIYSIEDLSQLIYDLKNANPEARISVKLVSEAGVGTVAAGVAKAHADNIVISGYDGGTGASPQSSIRHAGLPFELGIAETHQTLLLNNLRGRVKLQTDGQLKTGRDIIIAGILGAEEFAFGTGTLIALGCVMMRKCHLNTCPVGVATQDPELRSRFRGKPEHLINYFRFVAEEARDIMASLGIQKFDDLIGRTDLLETAESADSKISTLDLSPVLHQPEEALTEPCYCVENQIHRIDKILDRELIKKSAPAIQSKKTVSINMDITNTDRAAGTMLSGTVSKKYGDRGLPDDTIRCTFNGSAGQSFGAFLCSGITFRLEGDANDYFGKGLSGGKLIAVPPKGSTFIPEKNIIIGNTVLYGATSGEAYIRGIAGERFCVRNSGAIAVVEGTGDHCAEYMTGGRIIVLGEVGRNFAAGMSGGIAYVLNSEGNFEFFCNRGMVELSPVLDYEDQDFIKSTLQKHIDHTGSSVALKILERWHEYMPRFIKIMPLEYKFALQEKKLGQIKNQLKNIRLEEQLEELSDG